MAAMVTLDGKALGRSLQAVVTAAGAGRDEEWCPEQPHAKRARASNSRP
jgi:hypothetical protein